MADRTTKFLLAAIALGLWANVAGEWLKPVPVSASEQDVAITLSTIEQRVSQIARGTCPRIAFYDR